MNWKGVGVAAIALGMASSPYAQWIEQGDAGQLLSTAQTVTGSGTLSFIRGMISGDGDVDMFRVYISDFSIFSAHTESQYSLRDTQLYLFDSSGFGVAFNDDIDTLGGNERSRLQVGSPLYASRAPGIYYLAISSWDNDPFWRLNNGNPDYIFPAVANGGIAVGPRAGAGALLDWDDMSGFYQGAYQISLTGVSAVPEPGSMLALAGGLALFLRRRKADRA
jgi:hypothetical protein